MIQIHPVEAGSRGRFRSLIGLDEVPVVYLNIPKAACSSIKNHLYYLSTGGYLDDPLEIHRTLAASVRSPEYRQALPERISSRLRSFTFVRHPGKRAYSCFGEKICEEGRYSFPRVREHLVSAYGADFSGYGTPEYDLERHRQNFRRFLTFVGDNRRGETPLRRGRHWTPQMDAIRACQRVMAVDFIGRVENFAEDLAIALRGVPNADDLDLSMRLNEGPPQPFTYGDVVTADVAALSREIYRIDHELLAYPD